MVAMVLSNEGAAAIKLWEHGKNPAFKAYNDGTGTWTIGWGSTEGVTRGMRVSRETAESMFLWEIRKFEAAANRRITRPVSQGLFEAVVSLLYNVGAHGAKTPIRRINDGSSDAKIRAAFMMYRYAYDQRKRRKVVWPGLVNRRNKELAHWAAMDLRDAEAEAQIAWEAPPKKKKTTRPDRLPPASAPPLANVAAESKTAWALVSAKFALVIGYFTDWGSQAVGLTGQLVGAVPGTVTDTLGATSQVQQLSEAAGLDWATIGFSVVFLCAFVALIRHVSDKRLL